ncbi:hypothetical protein [Thiomicrorhabdus sp.]|uniref:hypothetical protein n=1 Tax=Thiomicrorhabdus sp. TaxID=2039724 RepID=UPI0029C64173|nr:hypothetical protein [Thiomicrorhabdus sp.]
MEEIFEQISKPGWWFSAVFAGILINLISSYLKTFIESRFSSLSKSLAEKNEKKKSARANRVLALSSSDSELYIALLNLNHMKLECIFEYLLSAVLLLFGIALQDNNPLIHTVAVIGAMLAAYTGLRATIRHGIESLIIADARLERSKNA